MVRRIIKGLALLVALVVVAVPVAALYVDDDMLASVIDGVPGAAGHTDAVLETKRAIRATLGAYANDTVAGFKSLYLDVLGFSGPSRTPRVVIDLAPPPGPRRPAPGPGMSPSAPAAPGPAPGPAPGSDPVPGSGAGAPAPPPPPPSADTADAAKTEGPGGGRPKTVVTAVTAAPARSARTAGEDDPEAVKDYKRGLLFYKGVGRARDFKEAARFFRRAAKKNHAEAQYILGIMSYLGQGMALDLAQAARWFRLAGEQDHAVAQYNLGFLYFEGKGVKKDDLQAFMWIDRSANLGDEKAIRARETLQKALPKDIFER